MKELAHQLIEENKRTRATFLDLGNCGLTELPEDLFKLGWLTELNLGYAPRTIEEYSSGIERKISTVYKNQSRTIRFEEHSNGKNDK